MTMLSVYRIQLFATIAVLVGATSGAGYYGWQHYSQPLPTGDIPIQSVQTTIIPPPELINPPLNADHYQWFAKAYDNWKTRQDRVLAAKILLAEEHNKNERKVIGKDLEILRDQCVKAAQRYNTQAAKMDPSLFTGREALALIDAARCK